MRRIIEKLREFGTKFYKYICFFFLTLWDIVKYPLLAIFLLFCIFWNVVYYGVLALWYITCFLLRSLAHFLFLLGHVIGLIWNFYLFLEEKIKNAIYTFIMILFWPFVYLDTLAIKLFNKFKDWLINLFFTIQDKIQKLFNRYLIWRKDKWWLHRLEFMLLSVLCSIFMYLLE